MYGTLQELSVCYKTGANLFRWHAFITLHKHCLTRVLVSECQLIKTFLKSWNSEYVQNFPQSVLHNTVLCLCYTHTGTVSKEVCQYIDILIISSNNSKLKMTL